MQIRVNFLRLGNGFVQPDIKRIGMEHVHDAHARTARRGNVLQIGEQSLLGADDLARVLEHRLARSGQAQRTRLVKEPAAQLARERCHMPAQRRLRHIKIAGSGNEAAMGDQRDELSVKFDVQAIKPPVKPGPIQADQLTTKATPRNRSTSGLDRISQKSSTCSIFTARMSLYAIRIVQ